MEGEANPYEETKPNVVVGQINSDIVGDYNDVENQRSVASSDFLSKKIFHNCSLEVPASGLNTSSLAPSRLTIFYDGRVCVFDAISAEKVREIMFIAETAASDAAKSIDAKNVAADCATASPVLTRSPSLQSTATATATALASPQAQVCPINRASFCKLQSELPIARRHSLQRFFEKRRDRLVSRNPYPNPSTPKSFDDTKANLSAAATSPESGCFGKSHVPQEEFQPNAPAAHVA